MEMKKSRSKSLEEITKRKVQVVWNEVGNIEKGKEKKITDSRG